MPATTRPRKKAAAKRTDAKQKVPTPRYNDQQKAVLAHLGISATGRSIAGLEEITTAIESAKMPVFLLPKGVKLDPQIDGLQKSELVDVVKLTVGRGSVQAALRAIKHDYVVVPTLRGFLVSPPVTP
jgi:hypothetical protein